MKMYTEKEMKEANEAIRRECAEGAVTLYEYWHGKTDRSDRLRAAIISAEPAQDDISEIQERVRDEDGLELSRSSIRRMMAQDDWKPEVNHG